MRPRRFIVLIGMVLTLSLFAPQAAHAATSYNEKLSSYMVNRYDRNPRGLPSLVLNEYVSSIARSHSYAMVRAGKLYHSNLRIVGAKIPGWRILGENVGVGPSLRAINTAFMNSPAHRANILCKCFRYIGVGVVYARGYYWVTHIFWG